MKKIVKYSIIALVLVSGGAAAWWSMAAPRPADLPETTAVRRGSIEETVLASGVLEASSIVSVGAQVSGIVESVAVTLGQSVAAGELVAEIDSLDQENAVKSTEASLANIQAQKLAQEATLVQAERAMDRAREMLAQSIVSQADYDSAEAALAGAKAQLAALEAQIQQATLTVESAKLDLSRTRITAPISGTVVAVVVEEGQTVSATQSAPTIVKIANLDSMLIKAEISEADVTRVEAGQKVYFSILGDPDTRIEATLLSVEPAPSSIASDTASDSTSTAIYYNGIFEVPNPDHRLRISMTAQVTIVLNEATDALVLPSSALREAGPDGKYVAQVFDPETKAITPRRVTVGLNNKVLAEIEDGLAEGDLVVASTTGGTAVKTATPQSNRPGGLLMGMGGGGGPRPAGM